MTDPEAIVANRTDRHPPQMIDGVADRLAHPSNLPVPSLTNADDEDRCAASLDQLDVRRTGSLAVDDHPATQTLDFVLVRYAGDASFVHPGDAVPRVREPRRQIPVVRENEQPLGIEVEPADWVDVFTRANEIDDGRSPLRVRSRRDIPLRLVEQQIDVALRHPDPPAVNADVVVSRIGLRAELPNRLAIDGHPALEHQLLGCASGSDAGLRENLLKPLHLLFQHIRPEGTERRQLSVCERLVEAVPGDPAAQ